MLTDNKPGKVCTCASLLSMLIEALLVSRREFSVLIEALLVSRRELSELMVLTRTEISSSIKPSLFNQALFLICYVCIIITSTVIIYFTTVITVVALLNIILAATHLKGVAVSHLKGVIKLNWNFCCMFRNMKMAIHCIMYTYNFFIVCIRLCLIPAFPKIFFNYRGKCLIVFLFIEEVLDQMLTVKTTSAFLLDLAISVVSRPAM